MAASALRIHIPTPLRQFVGGETAVQVAGGTVNEALANLAEQHPGLRKHLYGDDGKLRAFVNVYVNDEDIRYLDDLNTSVGEKDEVSIIPAVAGG